MSCANDPDAVVATWIGKWLLDVKTTSRAGFAQESVVLVLNACASTVTDVGARVLMPVVDPIDVFTVVVGFALLTGAGGVPFMALVVVVVASVVLVVIVLVLVEVIAVVAIAVILVAVLVIVVVAVVAGIVVALIVARGVVAAAVLVKVRVVAAMAVVAIVSVTVMVVMPVLVAVVRPMLGVVLAVVALPAELPSAIVLVSRLRVVGALLAPDAVVALARTEVLRVVTSGVSVPGLRALVAIAVPAVVDADSVVALAVAALAFGDVVSSSAAPLPPALVLDGFFVVFTGTVVENASVVVAVVVVAVAVAMAMVVVVFVNMLAMGLVDVIAVAVVVVSHPLHVLLHILRTSGHIPCCRTIWHLWSDNWLRLFAQRCVTLVVMAIAAVLVGVVDLVADMAVDMLETEGWLPIAIGCDVVSNTAPPSPTLLVGLFGRV